MAGPESNIMSVGEMIDVAFGEPEVNIVNHKLIQTILYLLARQLRVLERRVKIELGPAFAASTEPSASSLSVTEVRLHAMQKKKGAKAQSKVRGETIAAGEKGQIDKSSKAAAKSLPSDKTDRVISGKAALDKKLSEKSSSEPTSSDKTKSTDKKLSDKTPSDKSSSARTASDNKTSTDKTFSDEVSTDKTTTKTTTESTSTDKTTTKSTTEETSDKSSTDKSTTEKSTTDKSSTDKTTTDKSSTTKSSTDKSSSEKSTTDKSSTIPSSTDKSSTEKSSTEKSSTSKLTSDKTSTEPTSSGKSASVKAKAEDLLQLLDEIEMHRETELRIIHQRANSREVGEKSPSPMASLDSMEATYEKLLVVERLPKEEVKEHAARARSGSRSKTPRLSIVTQEQFGALARIVKQLQDKFDPTGVASFPENLKLMSELRKGASLTDAMAALQLSARLEATEKTLHNLMAIITEMASKTPGVDVNRTPEPVGQKAAASSDGMNVIFGAQETSSSHKKLTGVGKSTVKISSKIETDTFSQESLQLAEVNVLTPKSQHSGVLKSGVTDNIAKDTITHEELQNAMTSLYNDILNACNSLITKTTINANNVVKNVNRLEEKLNSALNLGTRMSDLENVISEYTSKINYLDSNLTAQMTNYQEELTQMQYDLEAGLDSMAEALANSGGDTTTAVAELNTCFNGLQSSLENAYLAQEEMKQTQSTFAFDLQEIRRKIEILSEVKSDREEVADALRDKAGISALNGLTSLQQFDAVRGDIEKKISSAYDKFNNQESVWQKIIDDVLRTFNDKADVIQVLGLRDEIAKHLNDLRSKVNAMMEIVGEPRAAAVAKKLFRDTACLSCATPAQILEEPGMIPALPAMRPPAVGAEATSVPNEEGDHLCYPGLRIPHPIDPRAHVCRRWCGGSHTVINDVIPRAPKGIIITSAEHKNTTAQGTDGKLYKVDEPLNPKPCSQCMIPASSPQLSERGYVTRDSSLSSLINREDSQQI